ncbi:MAG: methylmalonyl-CoA mutase family protein [Myxococcota bacterium]|nr:methylmalonyl-CoA mutase family protein [Myxococcota bacterium]
MGTRPWIMRTYAGHSSPRESNRLYRQNLARGQTGLSVAFDLPTQCGYDADHELARGEVGKVGVPISSLADLELLLEGIPLEEANPSMTINAPAAWLLALYVALAQRRGLDLAVLRGTVQNDVLKEFLARGTWIVGPEASLRLTRDVIEYTTAEMPSFSPINICSYHLREAGATAVQEVAYTLANAIAVLDALEVEPEVLPRVFGRISFFCNAGIRFVEEMCKMRVFTRLWERIGRERYGVTDPKLLRFRCGVQVHSLGLVAEQPENNLPRIVLEALGVLLSEGARARALQLPAWNEALGLPRPWDQQWSLRVQQILAYETDLLDYPDLFEGSTVVEAKTAEMEEAAWGMIQEVLEAGGAVEGIRDGSTRAAILASSASRLRAIAEGEQVVVGKNRFTEGEKSPLLAEGSAAILRPDPRAQEEQLARLEAHRSSRDPEEVSAALAELRGALVEGRNVMSPSIRCAHAGVTTGEWGEVLREVFGAWRSQAGPLPAGPGLQQSGDRSLQAEVAQLGEQLGRPLRLLLGKPGLDGHTGGAEQIALAARDAGWEVIYGGIRLSPAQIAAAAMQEDVHLVGLSILSGSHLELVPEVLRQLDVPLVVGGIIPEEDAALLRSQGVAAVYTPRDHDVQRVLGEMAAIVARSQGLA